MKNDIKTFMLNNLAIRYREFGEGKTVIFLHGFGASSDYWRQISKPLSEKFNIILLDLKGFGLSDKPLDDKYSIYDQADIVMTFIKEKNIKEVVLVGHSLGGAVALTTFLELDKKSNNPIERLVLIDSAGYPQKIPGFIYILRVPIISKLFLSMIPSHLNVKSVLKKIFFDDSKITDEMIKTYAYYMDLPGAHHALIKTADLIVPENINEIVKSYKDIRVPVLIIWGEEDEVIPLSIGQNFKRDISNSKLAIISKSGHVPHEEKPTETIQIISDFLENF